MTEPTAILRRCSTIGLWLAIGLQSGWLLVNTFSLHQPPGLDTIGAVLLIVVVLFAARRPGWRWPAVLLRLTMAADFLLAVVDRFGLLGAPGRPGVSWGDYRHFSDYTRSIVLAFLPAGLAPAAALAATIAEITLGLALLSGLNTRLAATGAAALLATYAIAMTISLPAAQQFHYNVILLCAAMAALATLCPASSRIRITELITRRHTKTTAASALDDRKTSNQQ
jgi:putative oxidoreductase